MIRPQHIIIVCGLVLPLACDKKSSNSAASYAFSSQANATIESTALNLSPRAKSIYLAEQDVGGAKYQCENDEAISCTGPSLMTGKYFSVGLLIQAGDKAMQAYLLQNEWSALSSTSQTFDFDSSNPAPAKGPLSCCDGEGDLANSDTYFSNVSYLFSYLDVTFSIPYTDTQKARVFDDMKAEHTVRFVLASDSVSGYQRGDLLYRDRDGVFKWVAPTGERTIARPEAPLTMDKAVVDYVSPFPNLKSQIPIIITQIDYINERKITTSERALKDEGRAYNIDFDASYFVAITLGSDALEQLQKVEDLLPHLHLSGLPHSTFEFSTAGNSKLKIQ